MKNRKGLMIILDGYGEAERGEFNAVDNANTPYLKRIKKDMPSCLLKTDSREVGLPDGTMGGSEVGHMTIGGGKVKRSMQVKIDDEIESGEFFNRHKFVSALAKLKENDGALHIAGLWSDKQIHSNINHTFALMKMAKMFGVQRVFVHAFTDGRDCAPRSCAKYFKMFEEKSKELKVGEIATVGGRFYVMDRENNLDRTSLAIQKMKESDYDFASYSKCVEESYEQDINDEFIKPARIKTSKKYSMDEKDLLIFFNTRGDRMKQPVKMAKEELPCDILTFCNFVEGVEYVYEEDFLKNTLSEYLSKQNLKQVKISESTKYAHVTYFFNGGREEPFENEDRIHIETQKTKDYSLTPYMRAKEITEKTIEVINKKKYDAVIINYSNPDMIGHTGNYDAVVSALEFLDGCVKDVVDCAIDNDYFVLICADHGNAEQMRDEFGQPQTAHTLNLVRCVVIDKDNNGIQLHDGALKDVAPTFLKLMDIAPNPDFEGSPLF